MKSAAATLVALTLYVSPLAMAQTGTAPSPNPPSTTATNAPDTAPQWHARQGGEIRASQLIGSSVKNPGNEVIGDINDVILDKDGKVAALVIGVGGFLGMGERQVAVAFDSVRVSQEGNSPVVVFNATKDGLRSAPTWTWSVERNGAPATEPRPDRITK